MVMEQEEWIYALPGSYQEEPWENNEKIASQAQQAWLLGRQYQLQLISVTKK